MDTAHIETTPTDCTLTGRTGLTGLAGKHVLLLQGPMGPFFLRFAKELETLGARVSKINFNGGDELYFRGMGSIAYRGSASEWPGWIECFCSEERVDVVFLFGDCRAYHRKAMGVAKRAGIPVYVFEEGYLRPDFITLEQGGVNGHSCMSPELELDAEVVEPDEPEVVGKTFWLGARYAMTYSWALTLLGWRYPGYEHHRDAHPIREGYRWLRGGARKLLWGYRDRGVLAQLTGPLSGRYFVVPLQVHNDFQLGHSRFASIEAFLEEVVASFAAHAESDHTLVIKHHPMDRPYRDYGRVLRDLSAVHGLEGRILYVADLHLPTVLQHARGTVVINSTVGLQSLHHGTPVIAQGQAVYNLPQLTAQCDLANFWRNTGTVNVAAVSHFVAWLRQHNQANGSFIRRLVADDVGASGIRWFENLAIECRTSETPAGARTRERAPTEGEAPARPPSRRPSDGTPIATPGPIPSGGQ